MCLLSYKHDLQYMKKNLFTILWNYLTYKTEKLLIMTYTLRHLQNLNNLQEFTIQYKNK